METPTLKPRTIADRLREFVDGEMTFPGNPDAVCGELIAALRNEIERVKVLEAKERGRTYWP